MKVFWKSKGFWAGVAGVAVLGWNEIGVKYFGWPSIPESIYGVLALFGLYARTVATGPLSLRGSK